MLVCWLMRRFFFSSFGREFIVDVSFVVWLDNMFIVDLFFFLIFMVVFSFFILFF